MRRLRAKLRFVGPASRHGVFRTKDTNGKLLSGSLTPSRPQSYTLVSACSGSFVGIISGTFASTCSGSFCGKGKKLDRVAAEGAAHLLLNSTR